MRGVRRQAPKWAFFHQCYVTWQSHLLCVKDRSDRGWGGLGEGSRHRRPVPPFFCTPCNDDDDDDKKNSRRNYKPHEQKSRILSPHSQFPAAWPPSSFSCINM